MCLSDKLAIIDSVPGDEKRDFFDVLQPPMKDVFMQGSKGERLHKKLQAYYIKNESTMKEFIHPKFQKNICENCTITVKIETRLNPKSKIF